MNDKNWEKITHEHKKEKVYKNCRNLQSAPGEKIEAIVKISTLSKSHKGRKESQLDGVLGLPTVNGFE